MSETNLIPCPFCGKTTFRYDGVPQRHAAYDLFANCARLMCYCGAQGPASKTDPTAAWNTRTPDPRITAADAMAKALDVVLATVKGADEVWWIDCPDKGGFDVEAIEAAIAAYNATRPLTGQEESDV